MYCSSSLSLCLLEMLVHMDIRHMPKSFSSFEANLPDQYIHQLIDINDLQPNWRNNPPKEFTKDLGTKWIVAQQQLAVKVPSAVLPTEFNVLINPAHSDFKFFQLKEVSELNADHRVW